MSIINIVNLIIGVMGVAIIAWGVLVVGWELCYSGYLTLVRKKCHISKLFLRQQLGAYILLGLEFIIAADIIRTFIQPTKEDLIVLGSIVAIRTVISYFLNKELEGTK